MPIGYDDGGFGDGGGERPEPGLPPDEFADALGDMNGPAVWTRWRTAEDERVCPECGPLDGIAWPDGEGPTPPLHNGCRCSREFAFFEFSVRAAGASR